MNRLSAGNKQVPERLMKPSGKSMQLQPENDSETLRNPRRVGYAARRSSISFWLGMEQDRRTKHGEN
jgi:hypothetical protein